MSTAMLAISQQCEFEIDLLHEAQAITSAPAGTSAVYSFSAASAFSGSPAVGVSPDASSQPCFPTARASMMRSKCLKPQRRVRFQGVGGRRRVIRGVIRALYYSLHIADPLDAGAAAAVVVQRRIAELCAPEAPVEQVLPRLHSAREFCTTREKTQRSPCCTASLEPRLNRCLPARSCLPVKQLLTGQLLAC